MKISLEEYITLRNGKLFS